MRINRKYVIGYDQDRQCIYGKDEDGNSKWIDPFTLKEAKKEMGKFDKNENNEKPVIYKLVPIKNKR